VRYKQSHDWPIASATVVLNLDGQKVTQARVVMGAVAPIPWRSQPAEAALVGQVVTDVIAAKAADAALAAARPMSNNAYKVQIAKVAVRRAILKAAGAAV
jgi:xanthine dehydrogenase YagS FAD-binding subunit